jgi:hypothetical protein
MLQVVRVLKNKGTFKVFPESAPSEVLEYNLIGFSGLEVLSSGKLEAHIEKRRGQDKFFLDFKE